MKELKTKYIFERVEKKYLLDEEKYFKFLKLTEPYIYADIYGISTICNIYYDTDNYDLIRTSLDKPVYKEKLRLRSYGIPNENSTVFLEIKKKCNGTVFKRRVSMSLAEVGTYLEFGKKPKSYNQVLHEIDYFMKYYNPKPRVYLAYDRIAYLGRENKDLRITFDSNIRSREYDLNLESGDYGEPLIDFNEYLMEIKVSDAMPIWLVKILSELEIYPVSFSKYGNVYRDSLEKGMISYV